MTSGYQSLHNRSGANPKYGIPKWMLLFTVLKSIRKVGGVSTKGDIFDVLPIKEGPWINQNGALPANVICYQQQWGLDLNVTHPNLCGFHQPRWSQGCTMRVLAWFHGGNPDSAEQGYISACCNYLHLTNAIIWPSRKNRQTHLVFSSGVPKKIGSLYRLKTHRGTHTTFTAWPLPGDKPLRNPKN